MTIRLLHGDCREVLRGLPDASVHCCITSPPYWGLRNYLPADHPQKHLEIGSEPTLQEWVATMVDVFREVRRVLRDDGTLWLNLGDSYCSTAPGTTNAPQRKGSKAQPGAWAVPRAQTPIGLKPKDLTGQPWRVAFALQDDGWWLRQELIWAKRNPMPESVTDRFTKAHEHVFLLSKSERYWFDLDAVKEPASENTHQRRAGTGVGFGHGYDKVEKPRYRAADAIPQGVGRRQGPPGNPAERPISPKAAQSSTENPGAYVDGKSERMGRGPGWRNKQNASFDEAMAVMPATRNPRSVRWLASEPFKGAHFATYPPELIEPFVLAGCPEGGTVLDPFGGSGTTGMVCDRNHRNAVLIDLDERNMPMAADRIVGDAPLFANVEVA